MDDGRAPVIKDYAEKYSALSDSDAKSMTQKMLEYDSREIGLKRKYFKVFSKVLPPLVVAKFFQLDHRVDILMAMKVESSLPPMDDPEGTLQEGMGKKDTSSHDVEQNQRR